MAPAMKRPAAAASAAATKKQRLEAVATKCKAVASLVEAAEGYPKKVTQMLAGNVKVCLSDIKEERHAYQTGMIEMIKEVVASVEAGHKEKIAGLQSKLAEADSEKATRATAAEAAAAVVKEKSDTLEASTGTATTASGAVTESISELAAAEKEQKVGDAELSKADSKRGVLEAMVSENLTTLKEGSPPDASKLAKALVAVAKEYGFDSHLLVATPPALTTAAADRSPFDLVVIQHLEEAFSAAISKLTEQLTNGEADKAARAAKVEEATKKNEECIQAEKEAKAKAAEDQKALKEAEVARKAADKAVKEFGPEMKRAAADAKAAESALKACQEVMTSFQELVDRVAEVEEPPAAEEEEAPAEAPAAEEEVPAGEAAAEQ